MRTFSDYVHYREGLGDGWIPFVQRPSSKIPSCKDYARRLIRKFKPKVVKQAPVAVQRPRVQPMTWSAVR